MRGVTVPGPIVGANQTISTHTPHAGRDKTAGAGSDNYTISTHTPHAGRDPTLGAINKADPISTHTPHAGRDSQQMEETKDEHYFYSHAPCGA